MKKRILIFAMAVITAVGLMACGNSDSDTQDNGRTSSEVTSDSESKNAATANSSDFTLTLENVDDFIEKMAQVDSRTVSDDEIVSQYALYLFTNQAYDIEGWIADDGDTVVIDYEGFMDGVAFQGGTASGQSLVLGSNSFISGFEDGLVGKKAGDVVELNLSFPDPYYNSPDLAGKPCTFKVTVNQVIPKFSDEGVLALGSELYTNVDEYKGYIRNMIMEVDLQLYKQYIAQYAIADIIDETEFADIPDEVLDSEYESINSYYGETASQYGMTLEDYLSACGTNLRDEELLYAQEHIIFLKIAKEQNVFVSDDDVQSVVDGLIEMYDDIASEDDVYNLVASKEAIRESLLSSKVVDYIYNVTTVVTSAE